MRLDDITPSTPGRTHFAGSLRAAIGCTQRTPYDAEFWVQTATWAQPACAQHVAGVMRRAHHEGAGPVMVYAERPGRPCHVDGDPRIPADPGPPAQQQQQRAGAA